MPTTARSKTFRVLAWILTAWFGLLTAGGFLTLLDYGLHHKEFPSLWDGISTHWPYQSHEGYVAGGALALGYGLVGIFMCRWVRKSFGWMRLSLPILAIIAWYVFVPEW